jgi:hypothetical protein
MSHNEEIMETEVDVQIENHGSLFLVTPMTAAGREWISKNVASEPWQWLGGSLSVEPRYAYSLAVGMKSDGLVIA